MNSYRRFQIAEAAALKATKEFGATSPEARLAWDTYEEVAAADNTIATRVTLDEDCDVSRQLVVGAGEGCLLYMQVLLPPRQMLDGRVLCGCVHMILLGLNRVQRPLVEGCSPHRDGLWSGFRGSLDCCLFLSLACCGTRCF